MKDKSNITKSPKRQSVRQIERLTWTTTNEPPKDRLNYRGHGINSTLEAPQKPPQGWKANPSTSRIISTPSSIQEDFEFGEILAVTLLSDIAHRRARQTLRFTLIIDRRLSGLLLRNHPIMPLFLSLQSHKKGSLNLLSGRPM